MRRSFGFTLVELLITLVTIGILASMILFAMSQVQTSAKEAKTMALITKLHNVVARQWDSYATRRVPIDTSGLSTQLAAEYRLRALRQIIRSEMPNRWRDVDAGVLNITLSDTTVKTGPPLPAIADAYQDYVTANLTVPADKNRFQNAECLYMIVTVGLDESAEGIRPFSDSDTGDVDGDGLQEFVDAWGVPISFVRWPVGFVDDPHQDGLIYNGGSTLVSDPTPPSPFHPFGHLSDLQPRKEPDDAGGTLVPCRCDQNAHHDPFDPRRVDPFAYRLYPLIYSAGPDKKYDIYSGPAADPPPAELDDPFSEICSANEGGAFTLAQRWQLAEAQDQTASTECDDYDPTSDVPKLTGIPFDLPDPLDASAADGELNHYDNIHNHLIGASLSRE